MYRCEFPDRKSYTHYVNSSSRQCLAYVNETERQALDAGIVFASFNQRSFVENYLELVLN
jgi:hypothetical protein